MDRTEPRWTMTPALRGRLLTAIDHEYADDHDVRTELRQLVRMHDAGDALAVDLVDVVEYFGLEHYAGTTDGS